MLQKLIQFLKGNNEETSNWVSVYQSTDEYLPRLLQMKLEARDIESRLLNQRDSAYNNFGLIHLLVFKDNVAIANEIIALEENE